MSSKLKLLYVHTTQGYAGTLTRESQHVFNYGMQDATHELGLTMPVRSESYSANILPGPLRQNLPEGYLKSWISENFGKTMHIDDFNVLALTGRDMIGRVRVSMDKEKVDDMPDAESLSDLLTWRGTEDLFDMLAAKYAAASGISGVQPKLLVPNVRDEENNVFEKSTVKDRDLIIKAAGDDFNGLPENEFHCMTIAKEAGLKTPRFWISDDKGLFLIERFDRNEQGDYLGFEDMTSLTGRQNDEKYNGSYEIAAKVVQQFASPAYTQDSLNELFKSIVLSMAVRNGDAHLKNFGLLYEHPRTSDIRLSPLYDIVNTTVYIPKDVPALRLDKAKLWPTRETLIAYGRMHCQVDRPAEVIDRVIDAALHYKPEIETGDIWVGVSREIERGCLSLSKGKVYSLGATQALKSNDDGLELP